jgi:ABC-type transport system involved in cytochrome c biogenesis permease subunit
MKLFFLSLFLFLCCVIPALAESVQGKDFPSSRLEMKDFSLLPILEDGRIKPLDSFARSTLKKYLGKDHLESMSAIQWLALSLFEPAEAATLEVFKIKDPTLRHQFGLTEKPKPIYSLAELASGLKATYPQTKLLLEKDSALLTHQEKLFLDLHEDAYEYTQIMRSFSLLLPLNVSLSAPLLKKLGKSETDSISYLDIKKIEQDLQLSAKKVLDKKGMDLSRYTDQESASVLLAFQIKTLTDAAKGNAILRVVPSRWSSETDQWHAPWDIIENGHGSPETAKIFGQWQKIALAWQHSNEQDWKLAIRELQQTIKEQEPSASDWRFPLEGTYNILQPFEASLFLYGGAFLLCIGFFLSGSRIFYKGTILFLGLGGALHLLGIAARILILMRPPVSTLYESLIFVSLVCVALGVTIERRTQQGAGLLTASIAALFLGLMAQSLSGPSDTMQVLTAVLNTQFWLATHVLCITFGYGWCVIAGVMAHFILIGTALNRLVGESLQRLIKILGNTALLALLFTSVGTILGGIWADQSWGRFWGWDPKENGALLIVLWLVWLIHGKLAGQIPLLYWLAGLAYLNVVVALAWIGVNLLGVGLHSYGFTDGLFWGLGLFSLFETILIGGLIWIHSQKHGRLLRHAP